MMARPPESDFTAEVYKAAAAEHAGVAAELYDLGHYVLANYVAGLAVESILRAYRYRVNPEFDSRHDLLRLYRLSRFADLFPAERISDYGGFMSAVAAQWSNSHRYRSEKALRSYLKKAKLDRAVKKGDFLKELTRRMVNAAAELVALGVQRWQR